ncbi:head GIN domain-containing protein [Microbacterium pumilum]|uniref:Putative auto-transporter adhesin head GIN domain-containing protein n=1 Tax=Microbacterium pumilum TaxID=344165 RepID=A0ABN2T0K6_9MICO
MHTVRFAVALVAVAPVLALAGCMPFVATGPMTSEERDIGAVSTVVLDTSGDISISEGAPALVIHAPQDALDRLTSDVDGDTLVLGTTPGANLRLGEVRYVLTVPDLEAIELNGSGDIDATVSSADSVRLDLDGSGDVEWTGLDTGKVDIGLSGSGDVELTGATGELAVELSGSGNVDADELQARDAVIAIDGSGNVDVAVSDTLSAEISGSGRVTYSGDPSVESDVSGSGDVVRD